jgi:tripartite ATP-independent transporter DctM subunit
MFAAVFLVLPFGFPVAFTLIGVALVFAFVGGLTTSFDPYLLSTLPLRAVGLMENDLLQAVPLFIYLGVILQRTTLARELLEAMASLFGAKPGGLGVSALLLGARLAPTTGAVGATVLTLGLLVLPNMLAGGYDRRFAAGLVCGAGTLGTVLPPSIILIVLADLMRGANAEGQTLRGLPVSGAMPAKDIYLGMLLPVAIILAGYLLYALAVAWRRPQWCPPSGAMTNAPRTKLRLALIILVPLGFLVLLLGSIVTGRIYAVEAAALGAIAATSYAAIRGELTLARFAETIRLVMQLTGMMFGLLLGASVFTLVFRGFGSDQLVHQLLGQIPGGYHGALGAVFGVAFVFGFFLDALEILLLVVPIAVPSLIAFGADPIWLAVLLAITVQTSFLMPPTGFALFLLRSVAPPELRTTDIYRGAPPFIAIQLVVLALLVAFPQLATWLPKG